MIITYNNKIVSHNNKWVSTDSSPVDPYNPLNLPPYTIRIKCNKFYDKVDDIWVIYEPYLKNGGTATLVDSENNIWDITKVSSDWSGLLAENWELLEVLGANTTGVTNMSNMFRNCERYLSTIPLFDTSDVTNMSGMFLGCSSLTSVPLFNTMKVTDMSYMFSMNTSIPYVMIIETVPLFDTRNVTNMSYMFFGCRIKNVPLFDTHNVTNMSNMFSLSRSPGGYSDGRLEAIPLFDTSNVTDMSDMFVLQCSLKTIPLLNTSKVTNMDRAFDYCENIESGALALYQQASTQSVPPTTHDATFRNCGFNSTTGKAELAQIPTSWGGTKA